MRKFAKFLVPALLLVAVIVSCSVMFASAEGEENVVYVYSTAAGKQRATDAGISEDKLIGSGTLSSAVTVKRTAGGTKTVTLSSGWDYNKCVEEIGKSEVTGNNTDIKVTGADKVFQISPLYRAVNALKDTGGTVVFLDEVVFEFSATMQNGQVNVSNLPEIAVGKSVTFTSVYGDFDNKENGRLVVDHLKCNAPALGLKGVVKFENINIVYKYEDADGYGTNEVGPKIFCHNNQLEIGTGVGVISQKYVSGDPTTGDRYFIIYGGGNDQFNYETSKTTITIKSGKWRAVYAGGYSSNTESETKKNVTGSSNIYVYGGEIETLNGSGSSHTALNAKGQLVTRYFAKVVGNSNIVVSGGKVTTLNGITGGGVGGNLTITVNYPANVTTINYKNTTNANALYPSGDKTATVTCNVLKNDSAKPTISEGFTSTATNLYFGEVNNIHATLNDNVTLKFDYKVTDKITDAMVSGEKVKYYLTIGDRIEAEEHIVENIVDGVITVAAELYATEMNEEVSVKFVIDGKECDTWTETFAGYALEMIKDNAEYAEVVYATLNYGAAAQKKFDSEVADADLANAGTPPYVQRKRRQYAGILYAERDGDRQLLRRRTRCD